MDAILIDSENRSVEIVQTAPQVIEVANSVVINSTGGGGGSGDITGVVAGEGLSGGSQTGQALLDVNVDGTTIEVNSADNLQVVNVL